MVLCFHDFTETSIVFDETLPNINKSKHPKTRGIQGIKRKDPCPRRTTKRGQTTKDRRVPEPPPVATSISNNKRGGPLEMTPSLEEPSPTTIAWLKIEIAWACCDAIDTFFYIKCLQN
jgi:hypothetical protein